MSLQMQDDSRVSMKIHAYSELWKDGMAMKFGSIGFLTYLKPIYPLKKENTMRLMV